MAQLGLWREGTQWIKQTGVHERAWKWLLALLHADLSGDNGAADSQPIPGSGTETCKGRSACALLDISHANVQSPLRAPCQARRHV